MGAALSTVRGQLKDDKDSAMLLERLNMLVKMAKEHLMLAEQDILNGRKGDQQIHAGTVVELERFYCVNAHEDSDIGNEAGEMLEAFVSGEIVKGVKTILTRGANLLFGNKSVGESEYSQMLVLWEHNTLIRMDVYHWKYEFSSSEVMKCVQSVYGALAMKRIVDIQKVHSAVLVHSISRAAEAYDKDVDIKSITDKVTDLHKQAKKMKAEIAPAHASIEGETFYNTPAVSY